MRWTGAQVRRVHKSTLDLESVLIRGPQMRPNEILAQVSRLQGSFGSFPPPGSAFASSGPKAFALAGLPIVSDVLLSVTAFNFSAKGTFTQYFRTKSGASAFLGRMLRGLLISLTASASQGCATSEGTGSTRRFSRITLRSIARTATHQRRSARRLSRTSPSAPHASRAHDES